MRVREPATGSRADRTPVTSELGSPLSRMRTGRPMNAVAMVVCLFASGGTGEMWKERRAAHPTLLLANLVTGTVDSPPLRSAGLWPRASVPWRLTCTIPAHRSPPKHLLALALVVIGSSSQAGPLERTAAAIEPSAVVRAVKRLATVPSYPYRPLLRMRRHRASPPRDEDRGRATNPGESAARCCGCACP